MKLTATVLKKLKACSRDLAIFQKEWPLGVEVNSDSLQRAHELDLDVGWLARNTSTPTTLLKVLAGDPRELVRQRVAFNTSTPTTLLKVLAGDSREGVRRWVAYNTSAPATTLKALAVDSSYWVREGVASNTKG